MGGSDSTADGGGGGFAGGMTSRARDFFGGGRTLDIGEGGRDGRREIFGQTSRKRPRKGFTPEDAKRKGSNRHISTVPTRSPFQYSLLGDTALASTAAPTLLG